MVKTLRRWQLSLLLLLLFVTEIFLPVFSGSIAQAATNPTPTFPNWHDTGVVVNGGSGPFLDPTLPNTLVVQDNAQNTSGSPDGTYSIDLNTGVRTKISDHIANYSDSSTGYFYQTLSNGPDPDSTFRAIRFSRNDPLGKPLGIKTNSFLQFDLSGTNQEVYTDSPDYKSAWASSDGGLTWKEIDPPFKQQHPYSTIYLLPSHTIPGSLYATVQSYDQNYAIYFSSDAGQNWELRSSGKLPGDGGYVFLSFLGSVQNNLSSTTLLNTVVLNVGYSDPHILPTFGFFSTDGARTFTQEDLSDPTFGLFQTPSQGLLKWQDLGVGKGSALSHSLDDGKTWQNLSLPSTLAVGGVKGQIQQASANPDLLLASDGKTIWYTMDGGKDWQPLCDAKFQVEISPYSPITLVGYYAASDDPVPPIKVYTLTLPDSSPKLHTAGVNPAATSYNTSYYAATQHNVSGVFQKYTANKLQLYGLPKTEAFREINPMDGKIYTVQYFERARLEYHPEFAGTPYEVELGLLGNQLTANRKSEQPFQPVANPQKANVNYYSQTGHTLQGKFLSYWQQNGGLAIYGYPISEPFQEVNPDDGKTYLVQYFERNRFEYHPENVGTPYEVELGLLGNTLLKQKGWL